MVRARVRAINMPYAIEKRYLKGGAVGQRGLDEGQGTLGILNGRNAPLAPLVGFRWWMLVVL